ARVARLAGPEGQRARGRHVVAAGGGAAVGGGVLNSQRLGSGGGRRDGESGRGRAGVALGDHRVADLERRGVNGRPDAVVEQNGDVVGALVGGGRVRPAVPGKVPGHNARGGRPDQEEHFG